MLVLTRKVLQKLLIGDGIVITVVEVHGGQVRIGIEAPASVKILREELSSRQPRAPKPAGPQTNPPLRGRGATKPPQSGG